MPSAPKFQTCLWFDTQGEDAAKFYVSIFPNSKITMTTRYPAVGQEIHGKPAGSVMTVQFELNGQKFTALNGGPIFTHSEAVSFEIHCDTQADIDYYWQRLGDGGDPKAQQCGWIKDKFGVSWQVVPKGMEEMMKDTNSPAGQRVFAAMLQMKKLNVAELEKAYKG